MYNPVNPVSLPTWYSAPKVISGEKPKGYLGNHEKPCKCGRYIAHEMTGICFACERAAMKTHFLNGESSKKEKSRV